MNTFFISLTENDNCVLLREKINSGDYLGPKGAIAISKEILTAAQPSLLTETKISDIMLHVNVLYSFLSSTNSANLLDKVAALPYVVSINYWANKAHEFEAYRKNLSAGEYHLLMVVWVRMLQKLNQYGLIDFMPNRRAMLYNKMITSYNKIAEKAFLESRKSPSFNQYDIGPASRLHLLGSSLLYELSKDGLYRYPQSSDGPDMKEKIWRYAMYHAQSNDREMAQVSYRLLRAIGYYKEAESIIQRAENIDQLQKAKQQ